MTLITPEYRKLLQEKITLGGMGVAAKEHRHFILSLAADCGARNVLDYGSGPRKWCEQFFEAQRKIKVHSYDPCVPGLEAEPPHCDFLVCIDVLEHIEPSCLDDVLMHIKRKTEKLAYFSICTKPAKKTFPDGRNCHLIVKPALWWMKEMMHYFDLTFFQKLDNGCVIMGTPNR